jgi:hypothetical protein
MTKLISIVGMPRSGTTALGHFLTDKHGYAFIPETHFFKVVSRKDIDPYRLPFACTMRKELILLYNRKSWNRSEYVDFCVEFAKVAFPTYNSEIIVEATPSNLKGIRNLISSDIKLFFIFRDCLDVCRSLQVVPWDNNTDIFNAIRWLAYTLVGCYLSLHRNCHLVFHQDLLHHRDALNLRLFKLINGYDFTGTSQGIAIDQSVEEPWKNQSSIQDKSPSIKKRSTKVRKVFIIYIISLVGKFTAYVTSSLLKD